MHSIQPNLNFYDIALYLHEKYDLGKICFTKSQYSNYKKTIIKIKNRISNNR